MDYVQPFDQPSNTNASYQNGDATLGIAGSVIDGRAIENTQREIVNAIIAAGLTPSRSVLNQLAQAIPILAAQAGINALITSAITKTVFGAGADFASLTAAFAWLSTQRIAATGSVTFQLAAGKYTITDSVLFTHPDGARVTIKGATLLGTLPTAINLTLTGNGSSARNSDTLANLALMRTIYATELSFFGSASWILNGNIGMVQDLLLSTNNPTINGQSNIAFIGAAASMTRIASFQAGFTGIICSRSQLDVYDSNYAMGCSFFGVSAATGAYIRLRPNSTLYSCSAGQNGLLSSPGGLIGVEDITATGPAAYVRYNGTDGIVGHTGSIIASVNWQSLNNGQYGFVAYNCGVVRAVGTTSSGNLTGFDCGNRGLLDASNSTGTNTQYGFTAYQGGWLYRTGSTCTGGTAASSPAVGTTGSDGGTVY